MHERGESKAMVKKGLDMRIGENAREVQDFKERTRRDVGDESINYKESQNG